MGDYVQITIPFKKVAALGYPILTAEVWKGTDSNPIKPDIPNVNNILEGNQFAWSLKGIEILNSQK